MENENLLLETVRRIESKLDSIDLRTQALEVWSAKRDGQITLAIGIASALGWLIGHFLKGG